MKCPYVLTTIKTETIEALHKEPFDWEDAEGVAKRDVAFNFLTIIYENQRMHDCIKEECAAWQNGRCIRTA